MLDVCLLGTGGMMPLPRRWLTALMTRYNSHSLLIDCGGKGTQMAIKEKGWSFKPVDGSVLPIITEITSADFLVFFLQWEMQNWHHRAHRTIGDGIGWFYLDWSEGLERVVNALRVIAPDSTFELKFIEINGPEQVFEINGYRITAFKVNHNVLCYGYSLEILQEGEIFPERAREQVGNAERIPLKYWNPLQKGQTIEADDVTYTRIWFWD